MNLHQIASGAIAAVNPFQPVTIQTSTGATVNADGTRMPTYAPASTVSGQVQQLTTRDLRQLEALSIQGSSRKIYLNGEVDAIVRVSQKGGDLITLPDGSIWLTTAVLEQWPDWVAVSVTLQDGS
jgi:hypothetical protein